MGKMLLSSTHKAALYLTKTPEVVGVKTDMVRLNANNSSGFGHRYRITGSQTGGVWLLAVVAGMSAKDRVFTR